MIHKNVALSYFIAPVVAVLFIACSSDAGTPLSDYEGLDSLTTGSSINTESPNDISMLNKSRELGFGVNGLVLYERSDALGRLGEGIVVNGIGEVTASPDIARLHIGVESIEPTVEHARATAGTAMNDVLRAIRSTGIQDEDIQTKFFRITPQYTWKEKQILTGYLVRNEATVVLRNLSRVGMVIDKAAAAAGDLARISGLEFLVEDRDSFEKMARAKAIEAAISKAEQYARLTGVSLGAPLVIEEVRGSSAIPYASMLRAEAFGDGMSGTPISEGESIVEAGVTIVFAIER